MIQVKVTTRCASVIETELITSGSAGMTVEVEFSAEWSGLNKVAVFCAGSVQRDVIISGNVATIPWECLQTANKNLELGIYGTDSGGNTIIPTIYAELGRIVPGADPSGDPSVDPTLPVWAQIRGEIGDLDDLSTDDKSNLVAAINEVYEHGGGGGTDDHRQLDNRDADNQHPMSAITGLEEALDSKADATDIPSLDGYATEQYVDAGLAEKQNIITDLADIRSGAAKGDTAYQKPTSGIPKADLASAVKTSLEKADSALQTVPSTYRTAAAQDVIDAAKADTADLAAVATSGNYNDLSNKPTIPSIAGLATETYVDSAIAAAIGTAIGGAY